MSNKVPSKLYTLKNNLVFAVVLFLWVMLFAVLYTPTFGYTPEAPYTDVPIVLQQWYAHSSFCIPILCSILIVTMAISRLLLYLFTHRNRISEIEFFVWQVCELVAVGMFCDLFISLYFQYSYLKMLPTVFLITILLTFAPYIGYWIYVEKKDTDKQLTEALHIIDELRQGIDRKNEPTPIKFIDEKGTPRLIVTSDHIYTIEAAGNYVTILYENNGKLVRFALRNTLKAIEPLCEQNGLIRCHRSWMVNLKKIRLLRHDPDGIYAEINAEGINDIPVSKNYAANVVQHLSEN